MELLGVENMKVEAALTICNKFSLEHNQAMQFDLSLSERRQVWHSMYSVLVCPALVQAHYAALDCCRLLSRDKTGLNEGVTEEMVLTLLELTGILTPTLPLKDDMVALEAAKVLFNLLRQSGCVQSYCTNNGFLSNILSRISEHSSLQISNHHIKVFDLRLLFLFTALCPEQRNIAKHNHCGVSVIRDSIEKGILEQKSLLDDPCLETEECAVICETLKVIFNLTVDSKPEDFSDLKQVSATVNRLLRITIQDCECRTKIVQDCINVVTNMEANGDILGELVKPTDIQLPAEPDIVVEGELVVNTVTAFVDFLGLRLSNTGPGSTLKEDITPVLSVLYNFARALRPVRKYLKSLLLPPLQARDLKAKPEEGDSIKSRLVSLLTNTNGDISTMVAELLFILCKEDVGRLIKHTGYGNAAGLLARRGLMAGGKRKGETEYSEDEESDSEEYRAERHKVNPVTGCEEKVTRSPFEGMTEDQKAHEAIQLVNLMDKMTRSGIIQPCRLGKDGRPEAVESVLQLQEGMLGPPKSEDEDSE